MEPPVIDVHDLVASSSSRAGRSAVGEAVVRACRDVGFLQVVGHGVEPALRTRLLDAARRFFALPEEEKDRIAMRHAGIAWRGWFPLGGELTSGVPDGKEGIYFGTELDREDPAVRAGVPLHGPNLVPERPAELGPLVLEWMDAVTGVGQALLRGIALGLGLEERWFDRWCADPTVLFRIFRYPAAPARSTSSPGSSSPGAAWGVAEHTDYGLLTLLAQDDTGGLEVRRVEDREWVPVPVVDDAFVCNIGDMLERCTGGAFRSTPHRVAVPTAERISMPLFLDPAWDARVGPLPGMAPTDGARTAADLDRWDGESVFDVEGTYGEHLTTRVARVFPELLRAAAGEDGAAPAVPSVDG
jgi:isopenicillin N synthase-like dioxygenase